MAFHGKLALITGGASGIGKEHTLQLVKQGAKVVVLDLNEKGLEEASAFSENIITFKCDVTKLEEVQIIIDKIENEIGTIDRLVHCAAIMPGGLLSELSADYINKVMKVNYFGMVNMVQTILPYLLKRNAGDLIVYGSIAGIVISKRFGAYGATKSANNFYMKALMLENRKSNIRFQLVCPPAVDTPLINQAKATGPLFLKNIQTTRKNLVTPELVVEKVEKCLEKGIQVNYPGPAKLIKILYPLFPNLVNKIVNKGDN